MACRSAPATDPRTGRTGNRESQLRMVVPAGAVVSNLLLTPLHRRHDRRRATVRAQPLALSAPEVAQANRSLQPPPLLAQTSAVDGIRSRLAKVRDRERASETSINLCHEPVRQRTDAVLQSTAIEGGDLCDVDDAIGIDRADLDGNRDVAWKCRELRVGREHCNGHRAKLGTVVGVGADDHHRAPERGCRASG